MAETSTAREAGQEAKDPAPPKTRDGPPTTPVLRRELPQWYHAPSGRVERAR